MQQSIVIVVFIQESINLSRAIPVYSWLLRLHLALPLASDLCVQVAMIHSVLIFVSIR
jgi:hypothetical protein